MRLKIGFSNFWYRYATVYLSIWQDIRTDLIWFRIKSVNNSGVILLVVFDIDGIVLCFERLVGLFAQSIFIFFTNL